MGYFVTAFVHFQIIKWMYEEIGFNTNVNLLSTDKFGSYIFLLFLGTKNQNFLERRKLPRQSHREQQKTQVKGIVWSTAANTTDKSRRMRIDYCFRDLVIREFGESCCSCKQGTEAKV